MENRQKIVIGLIVVIVAFLVWQVMSMMGGDSVPPTTETPATQPAPTNANGSVNGAAAPKQQASAPSGPAPATLPAPALSPAQQAELARLQQETQARYISSLNELQLLKVAKEIAEANKDIVSAKLAMINSQKEIVDRLSPTAAAPQPVNTMGYGQSLGGAPALPTPETQPPVVAQAAPTYVVISVTEIMNKWSAVLGSQGRLYNVSVGDTLSDGSKVKSIDRTGVILEKDGESKKISLVPLI